MTHATQFNARHVGASDIAADFVAPDEFLGIANSQQNTLLIGPRGSGKTTILKTLTTMGLFHLYKRDDLADLLDQLSVTYFPVYIPAEASWKGDAEAIKKAIPNNSHRNHIQTGLLVTHSLYHVVRALEDSQILAAKGDYDQQFPWLLSISKDQEQSFSRLLSELWRLPKIQTSFVGLKLSLTARHSDLISPMTVRTDQALEAALDVPALDLITMLKGVMDVVQSENVGLNWSFNFDEMEIAPKHVVSMLYEHLRSWDQRAILKFSLFPFVDFYTFDEKMRSAEKGPVEGPDFEAFHLTNEFKRKSSKFTDGLVALECSRRGITIFDFASYLNSSRAIHKGTRNFDGLRTTRNFDGIFKKAFTEKTDQAFIKYARKQGFETAQQLSGLSGETERARHVRKIAPICEFRNYYLSEDRSKPNRSRRGSTKGFGYYHGYDKIIALTEGNPRAIKFYVNDLLDAMDTRAQSRFAQNAAIRRNVDRFRALIASQVVPVQGSTGPLTNSLGAVDRFGRELSSEILSAEFHPQPKLSLEFRNMEPQLIKIIEIAVNAGALIVDRSRDESKLVFDLDGQRMRLSYGLAPFMPLPTITGTPAVFSDLPNSRNTASEQSDLFQWDEI